MTAAGGNRAHASGLTPVPGPGSAPAPDVIFYDGLCGFCDLFVQFVLKRDRSGHFRFAPLQGRFAARELPPRGGQPQDLDTVYVLTGRGRLLRKSRAVLYVVQRLGGAWRAVGLFRVIPAFIADLVYDLVARVRYRLFGKFDACRVPNPGERGRFLQDPPEGSSQLPP